MSVQDAANLLVSSASMTEPMGMAQAVRTHAENATSIAAQCLGEEHLGTTAITGAATAVVILTEQLVEALGTLQFTMENVGNQVRQGGGSY